MTWCARAASMAPRAEEGNMNEPSTVIIGDSLGDESERVLRVGLAAASALGAVAHVVHAYEDHALQVVAAAEPRGYVAAQDGRRTAWTVLQQQARGLEVPDEQVRMRPGPADRILAEEAASRRASLVVVGGRQDLGRWPGIGSTADRLSNTLHCPLLIVHPGAPFPPRAALAPVDLSEISAGGLRSGLPLLERWGVAAESVEVLFVLDPLESQGWPHFAPADVARFAAEELERFTIFNGGAHAAGLRRRVRVGKARVEAIEEAATGPYDLLLVSTRGRSGWKRWLDGSFAATVAHRVRGSVLVVPPNAAGAELARRATGADWQYVGDERPC